MGDGDGRRQNNRNVWFLIFVWYIGLAIRFLRLRILHLLHRKSTCFLQKDIELNVHLNQGATNEKAIWKKDW